MPPSARLVIISQLDGKKTATIPIAADKKMPALPIHTKISDRVKPQLSHFLIVSIPRSGSGRFRRSWTFGVCTKAIDLSRGSAGAEHALASLLEGLLRSSPTLRAAFIVLGCSHFFNCFQRLNCQFWWGIQRHLLVEITHRPTCSRLSDFIERLQCRWESSTSYYCCQRLPTYLKEEWLVCCLS
jgi:hypothetical protein